MKKVTLQDIADELGISKGTVDRAIHNRPGVSAATREKVLNLVKKYNYKPNKVARLLSLKSKMINIGVICQSNPAFFWNNVKAGIKAAEAELADFGMQLILKELKNYREVNELLEKIDELTVEKIDGLVIVPVNSDRLRKKINELSQKSIAVATLNDDITDSSRLFYVGPQMRQSGRIAGELIAKFLRLKGRVVTLNPSIQSLEYEERLRGFKEILREEYKGINLIAEYTFNYDALGENGQNVIKSILENTGEFDAIYDVDGVSLYDIGCIVKNSKKLRNAIVVGHEVSENVKRLMEDGIIHACISQDPFSQGYYVIKLLFDYLVECKKPPFDRMYTRLDVIFKENMISPRNIINSYSSTSSGPVAGS